MFAIFNVGFRDKYVELCRLAIQSLHEHHPEIKILVVADEHVVEALRKEEYATIIPAPRCNSIWQILRRKCDILEIARAHLTPGLVLYFDSDLVVRKRFDSWLNTIQGTPGIHALAEGEWGKPWWSPQRFSLEGKLDRRTFNNGIMGFHYPEMESVFRDAGRLMDQFPGETSDQVYFNAVAAQEKCLMTSLPSKAVRLFASYNRKELEDDVIFVHACGLGTDPAEKLAALQAVAPPSKIEVNVHE